MMRGIIKDKSYNLYTVFILKQSLILNESQILILTGKYLISALDVLSVIPRLEFRRKYFSAIVYHLFSNHYYRQLLAQFHKTAIIQAFHI